MGRPIRDVKAWYQDLRDSNEENFFKQCIKKGLPEI